MTPAPLDPEGTPHDCLRNFPVTLFGSVMGLVGLAIAAMRFEHILHIKVYIGPGVLYASFAWFALLTLIYMAKAIRHPDEVRKEFQHPIRINFFPAYSISLLLLSIGYLELNPGISKVLWLIGTPLHLFYTLSILRLWVLRDLHTKHFNPAWFIPVVGTILVPIAGVTHASPEISWFFFSAGFFFWIFLMGLLVNRLLFFPPIPRKLMPTFFIILAPPAVGFVAYVKLTGGLDGAGRMLFYLGVFLFMWLVAMLPSFRKLPFFLSWWAFTFPLDALTISFLLMFKLTGVVLFKYVAMMLLPITALVILVVLVRTVRAALAREICVVE